jgi:hypothetical protein
LSGHDRVLGHGYTLLARIECHRALMNEERPGLNVTLSAAIRVLVEQALEFAESAAKARGAGSSRT